jgi:SpoVK/Ycf46/Vps4 family AAA+-type ATPase
MTESRKLELEHLLIERPLDRTLRLEYAALLATLGDEAAARSQYQLVLGLHPNDAAATSALAELEASKAKSNDAADSEPSAPKSPVEGARTPLRVVPLGSAPATEADVVSISRSGTVRFSDIIGMEELKKLLRLRIIEPFQKPGLFARFRKKAGGGVLLYGPPGCGKTMIARAIAYECKASFTSIGISEVLNMWLGESERNLAQAFEQARQTAPTVLFFDELDALAFSRSKTQSSHTRTLVNEFLAQLDGMTGSNDKVLVLAATNMPWDVDDAMKRPGRFDRQIFVPPPDSVARSEMLRTKLRDVPVDSIDYDRVAKKAEHFSGADIDGLIDGAKETVLDEIVQGNPERGLRTDDLLGALEDLSPSTLDWLKVAKNLVKFGGGGPKYKDVEAYLRSAKLY